MIDKFKSFFRKKDAITKFWVWFSKNSKQIYSFEKNQNTIFRSIKRELNKIDSNLVFEFSQILDNKKREFVISADGIKSSFSNVKKIVNNAPILDDWEIIAFRQPNNSINELSIDSIKVNFSNVYFKYQKNINNIDIELYLPNFIESPEWTSLSFLMLDVILGEYNTEMYLNTIDKKLLKENDIKNLIPIRSLPKLLNQLKLEVSN